MNLCVLCVSVSLCQKKTAPLSNTSKAHHTMQTHSHIWHPFTQMLTSPPPIFVDRAEGAYLIGKDGTRYLDGISSWWVNLHGHTHPYIASKIAHQLERLEQVLLAGFTHQPALDLAKRLCTILPGPMSKVFYADNGATAVETALKIALQYWYNLDPQTSRKKIISFNRGYHGDTFGAMSAAKSNFNKPFWSHLFEVHQIDPPLPEQEETSLNQLRDLLEKGDIACMIYEPLIIAVGGMWVYSVEALNPLLALCRQHQVLLIADEVMTGFGRTETIFASEQVNEKPDMICLSKGLTGGFLPLGATACTESIFEAFLSKDISQALLHGHSYCGNPLACVSALASLDLLEQDRCFAQRAMIASKHGAFCHTWRGHPALKRCESKGTLLALEYSVEEAEAGYHHPISHRLYRYFLSHHLLLRPFGNVLHLLPPYCIAAEELDQAYHLITQTFEEYPWKNSTPF